MTFVARFAGSVLDYLIKQRIEIVKNSVGKMVIHQYDAEDFLKPTDYIIEEWVPYFVNGLEIGAPRPKKPRS